MPVSTGDRLTLLVKVLVKVLATVLTTLLATGAALVPTTGAVAKPTFTPEERSAAIARPAVVYVEVQWEGWVRDKVTGKLWDDRSVTLAARCSGFAVSNDGFMVTAGHCVDPGVQGVAISFFEEIAARYLEAGVIAENQQEALIRDMINNSVIEGQSAGEPAVRDVFAQRGVAKSGLTSGEAMQARVVSFHPVHEGDVALLKMERSNQPMVKLAESADINIGTDVLAIGYPASADAISDATLEPSNKDGKISNKRTENGVPFYETSAATTQGMSGGPVANLDGDVIGLISHGPAGERQAFNFLAASSVIADELAKNGVKNDFGKIDRDYREGLDAYFDGRYTAAIEKFDAVLVTVPSHAQAQEYQQKAVSLRASEGEPLSPAFLIIGGTVGFLIFAVIVAIIILLLVRGRRRRPAPALVSGYPGMAPVSYPPISGGPPNPYSPTPPYSAQPSYSAPPAPQYSGPPSPQYSPAPQYAPPPPPPISAQPVSPPPPVSAPPVSPPPVSTPPPGLPPAPGQLQPASPPVPQPPPPANITNPSSPASPPPIPAQTPAPASGGSSLQYCTNCGNASAVGTTFCATCGQQFPR